ncbi:hypothetical protein [Synechococcus sp. PCC 6312]|uniref:hypothetical protein n=1 Tax=Synechococcus sp. (strain ATCC 27167 / PCC 6312) TaxID=195253 RepID=UPI00029F4643|nr:hypothetical protein [Synechococcus sp. PCC 6312]AFY61496.1 hypothetical protein Syn6312_2391 [Synechococcus sp. PCC 6312]
MLLTELFPVVNQLSHQDKLRLIHLLLMAVAKDEGFDLHTSDIRETEIEMLKQLEASEAVVWSPYDAYDAAQTLADLLVVAKQENHA